MRLNDRIVYIAIICSLVLIEAKPTVEWQSIRNIWLLYINVIFVNLTCYFWLNKFLSQSKCVRHQIVTTRNVMIITASYKLTSFICDHSATTRLGCELQSPLKSLMEVSEQNCYWDVIIKLCPWAVFSRRCMHPLGVFFCLVLVFALELYIDFYSFGHQPFGVTPPSSEVVV